MYRLILCLLAVLGCAPAWAQTFPSPTFLNLHVNGATTLNGGTLGGSYTGGTFVGPTISGGTIIAGTVSGTDLSAGAVTVPSGTTARTPAQIAAGCDPTGNNCALFEVKFWGFSAGGTGAANTAAIQAAINAACNAQLAGYAAVVLPAGNFTLGTTTITIPCEQLDIYGQGPGSTVLNVTTGGAPVTPFKYVQAPGDVWSGRGSFHDLSLIATDSPSGGVGLSLDHGNFIRVYNAFVQGFYIDIDCNTCNNVKLGPNVDLGGPETVAGATMLNVHKTVTTVATVGDTPSGKNITLASATGAYNGMGVTGVNVAASTTLTCNGTVNCVLSNAVTGDVPNGTVLTLTDSFNPNLSLDGYRLQATNVFPFVNYTYGIVIRDVDGFWLGEGHISWVTQSDMLVQPEHATDTIDNILINRTAYFDKAGSASSIATGLDFEPYGAVYATTSGSTASGNPVLNLTGAPSTDVTGYRVLATGVTVNTTCSSGCTTSTPTMSGNANSLGVASGAKVIFYPTFTGASNSHSLAGYFQGAQSDAIAFNDPALVNVTAAMMVQSSNNSAIHVRAGTSFNFNGGFITASNASNGGYPDILIEGNATHMNLSGMSFSAGAHAPPYHISKQGQANFMMAGSLDFAGSATADIIDQSLATIHTNIGACTTDQVTVLPVGALGCTNIVAGGNGTTTYNLSFNSSAGNPNFVMSGLQTGSAAYPQTVAVGGAGGAQIFSAGGSAGTLNLFGKASGAGTINIGVANNDTISLGGASSVINYDGTAGVTSSGAPTAGFASTAGGVTAH